MQLKFKNWRWWVSLPLYLIFAILWCFAGLTVLVAHWLTEGGVQLDKFIDWLIGFKDPLDAWVDTGVSEPKLKADDD